MIPVEQVTRLAELYDTYNNALDPFPESCKEARRQFEDLTTALHRSQAADVNFTEFRSELVRHCRESLRKNLPL